MYHPPESFVEQLDRAFRGRLRIRWSHERGEWHIEQKIRRGLFPGQKPSKLGWDETTDAYIRHRDGTHFVMAVRTGDRMPCPRCGAELKVPFMQTEHVSCAFCKLKGKQHHVAAAFIPLNDTLIGYLKKIDPENPASEGLAEGVELQNAALAAAMEKQASDDAIAAFSERYNRLVGIPQVGWTPKMGTGRY